MIAFHVLPWAVVVLLKTIVFNKNMSFSYKLIRSSWTKCLYCGIFKKNMWHGNMSSS